MVSEHSLISRTLILLIFLASSFFGYAQVTLTASSGTASGSFTTLKGAFDAINAGTHQGVIVISINVSTNETASAVLNASGSGFCSYTGISIIPTNTGLSISGSLDGFPIIDFNGADNVTIDGRVNGTGSTRSLNIINASTSSASLTSTIRFIGDASSNSVQYCTLKGSSTSTGAGIVFFSTATTTGNDNNTITNNDITSAANAYRPLSAIYASGSIANNNDNNTISNNNIYDFLNPTNVSQAINISSYNSGYTISGNSFYETTSLAPSSNVEYRVIFIKAATGGGNGFTISGNYIGGRANSCGGTAFTKTNSAANLFYPILVSTASGVASSIQGNTIKNFNWANSAAADFIVIRIESPTVADIGTVTGNTIGAASGTGSILFTSDHTAATSFVGILLLTNGAVNCQNNTIGAITTAHSFNSYATHFNGIQSGSAYSGALTISGNTIGSTTTSGSIQASSTSISLVQNIFGIRCESSGANTISGNTVANLVNACENAASTPSRSIGIFGSNGTFTISNNTVRSLSYAAFNNSTGSTASVVGIALSSPSVAAPNTHMVSGNTVYNLSNSYVSFQGEVTGISYSGPTTATSTVSRNFIHSLSVTGASSTAAKLYGIRTTAGSTTYSNNIISLGGNTTTQVYGIYESGGGVSDISRLYLTRFTSPAAWLQGRPIFRMHSTAPRARTPGISETMCW